MRYLSLFSGIEAATQAWQPLGWECVAVSEIEPFPCAVLEHHYPDIPNLGDVTKITEQQIKDLGQIDLIVFGSPCQNLSVAGNRKGFEGEQSSLFYAAMEIIKHAKRHCKTRFALWENVPGAFSSNKGADFTEVVKHMAGLDDLDTPTNGWGKEGAALGSNGLLEWSVLDAQWFGLAQRRKRVFAIVDFGDWTSRPPILLERESLRGDSAPSRETGQDFTADVGASTEGKSWYSVDTQQPPARLAHEIAPCLAASMYKEPPSVMQFPSEPYQQVAENKLVVFAEPSRARALDVLTATDPSPTLSAKMGTGGNNMPLLCIKEAVAIQSTVIGRKPENGPQGSGHDKEVCFTLTSADRHAVAYGFATKQMGLDVTRECANTLVATDYKEPQSVFMKGCAYGVTSKGNGDVFEKYELHTTLSTGGGQAGQGYPCARIANVVRRLTPIECEKLQGFPPNFTKIPYRNKPADECPNGVRYKALGNSMAVNVMAWIGQRVQATQGVKVYGAKTL